MMESNQSAARDARRYLTERVRNDWAFPGIDDGAAADSPDAPATTFRYEPSEEELRGVSEFRERYYGSTDDDNDSSDDGEDGQEQGAGNDAEGKEYKFDSPDHVGRRLEERAERRKRRRRARLEEEMAWNEGVTCFVRRRDAWTGAASVRKFARRRSRASGDMEPDEVEAQRAVEKVLEETAVVEEVVVVKKEEEEEEEEGEQKGDSANEAEAEVEVDGGGEVGESAEGPKETERRINIDIPASEEPLVPLAPPMLPHNAIRQSITPKAYPDIYGKIVVAGQTPKVPINLAHMTRALVQGWKDDGEWPPRPGPVDPLMGRKKIAIGGGKVSTLAAVLGGGSGDNKGNASTGSAHHGEFLAHHPHLQRGVESVKKVFRLSGGHHGHSNPGGGLVHDGQPPAS